MGERLRLIAVFVGACACAAWGQATMPAATSSSPVQGPAPMAFEVATVKPVEHQPLGGRYIKMDGPHRFIAKDYTLKLLIAAAFDQSAKTISDGPSWMDDAHFDIQAITPGDARPTREEQMAMLRSLLVERFGLKFHLQSKEFSIYELQIVKTGTKLKPAPASDEPTALICTVYPGRVHLPARNATMHEFALMLQRAVFDRPVVDHTGLPGRYNFELDWAPDETQFSGELPPTPSDVLTAPFFVALQEQLGLRLEAKRGPVNALVVEAARQPAAS